MITAGSRFNIYLLLCLAGLACGCHTAGDDKKEADEEKGKKDKKSVATLAIHLEVTPSSMDFSQKVQVFRAMPVEVTVDRDPFLTEAYISEVKVVPAEGGAFALQVQFDRRGTWLLENYTTSNPGKHFAIFVKFGETLKDGRWLGAPIIRRRISNGTLTFTPDASREEADEIVRGLNNVAKKVQDQSRWN